MKYWTSRQVELVETSRKVSLFEPSLLNPEGTRQAVLKIVKAVIPVSKGGAASRQRSKDDEDACDWTVDVES